MEQRADWARALEGRWSGGEEMQAHLRLPDASGSVQVDGQIGCAEARRHAFARPAMIRELSVHVGNGVSSRDARARGGECGKHAASEPARGAAAAAAAVGWFKVWHVSGKRRVAERGMKGGEGEGDGRRRRSTRSRSRSRFILTTRKATHLRQSEVGRETVQYSTAFPNRLFSVIIIRSAGAQANICV